MNDKYKQICFGTDILPEYRNEKNTIKKLYKRGRTYISFIIHRNWKALHKDICFKKIINEAYKQNCVIFDTSRAYGGSEAALGEAIKSFHREDLYIVSKISNTDQRTIGAKKALELSLSALGIDYIDCYLIHWPQPGTWIQCWKEMEELYKSGKCREIGVCNCNIHHIEELKKYAEVMPMVNQFECHPLFIQEELVEYCKRNNIKIMAYTSVGRNDFRLCNSKRLEAICNKYNKSRTQIILKWHIQRGLIPIFSSYNIKHIKENLLIDDFSLSEEDIKIISSININSRLRYDPDNCDFDRL